MYCDRTDLAVCGSTHIRAPYAGTGGNDVVHSPLFQVTAGIFPDQAGDDVQREQLAVMSMAAEIKVCACGYHFIQLTGLMIHKNNRECFVKVGCKLVRILTGVGHFSAARRILTACQIKPFIYEDGFVIEKPDVGRFQKIPHSGIIIIFFCIAEGKTGQNRFAEIMVAPTGINAVSGFQRTENGRCFFRVFDPFIFVIKNIAGNTDQIRIFGVDLFYKKPGMFFSDTVTEMNVCEQDDLQGVHSLHLLVYFHIISFCLNIPLIKNPIETDTNDQKGADSACDYEGFPGIHPGRMKRMLQDQSAEICSYDYDQDVKKCSLKIICRIFQEAVERRGLPDEKTGQKRSGQKNINTCKACPERKGLEKMSTGTHPQNHPADDININEHI